MFLNKYKVIGILGGMGPDATTDLYNNIVRKTPAAKDQDHIPALIFSNPKIPDRTASIQSGQTEEIIEYLTKSVKIIEDGGADFIVIPCNTAHQFYDEMTSAVSIPILHIVDQTADHIKREFENIQRVGLLGTSGTLKTRLYQESLKKHGIETVMVSDEVQEAYVMKAIYTFIKSGDSLSEARKLLIQAIRTLPEDAQKVVVMGCTEIPLAFKEPVHGINLVNPTMILAEAAIRESQTEI